MFLVIKETISVVSESVELQCRPEAHERVAAALCTHKPNRA